MLQFFHLTVGITQGGFILANAVLQIVLGVCCTCQTALPVRYVRNCGLSEAEIESMTDPVTGIVDEVASYVMEEHRVAGLEHGVPMCEGVNTTPQCIVRPKQ